MYNWSISLLPPIVLENLFVHNPFFLSDNLISCLIILINQNENLFIYPYFLHQSQQPSLRGTHIFNEN